MSTGLVVLGTLAAITACARLHQVWEAWREGPVQPISELTDNTHGHLVGRVRAFGPTLTAPLSGRACVWYLTIVRFDTQEYVRECRGTKFLLEDASEIALIDPTRAEIDSEPERARSGMLRDATARQEAFLARHGRDPVGRLFNKPLTYCEALIGVGDTLHVIGTGTRLVETGGPYRTGRAPQLELHHPPRAKLSIRK